MRTIEFKMERQGLINKGDRVRIIEREGTSSYSYIIDPAVAMSGCFAARYRIKSEYSIVKDIRKNSRGFYVIVDFDEDESDQYPVPIRPGTLHQSNRRQTKGVWNIKQFQKHRKSQAAKSLLVTSLTVGAVCLIIGTCLYHMALDAHIDKSGLLKPSPHANPVPRRHPLDLEKSKKLREQYQDVKILSFDHLKLHEYLYTQKGSSQDTDRWAILVYGYGDSGLWFRGEVLASYRQGFHPLLPDAKGYGKSQGTYVGMGWYDRLDTINWIYWIIRQDSCAKIVLYGVSMGAAAVVMTAGEPLPDHVKAAMEDCEYTSAWDVLKYQLKVQFHLPAFSALTCAGLMTRLKTGYGLKEADALRSVSRTKLPILFIHGTEDRFVPFEMCRMLYDTCRNEKEYLAIEGAVHVRSAMVSGPAHWNKVLQFINSYI